LVAEETRTWLPLSSGHLAANRCKATRVIYGSLYMQCRIKANRPSQRSSSNLRFEDALIKVSSGARGICEAVLSGFSLITSQIATTNTADPEARPFNLPDQ